jgi:adenylate cyclase
MLEERMKRKLSAILSADIQGYGRLMGEDEIGTIRTLKNYRGVMSSLIEEHRGRVVDSPGDNLLAEFVSAIDSIECAVKIQQDLKVRNDELPENRKMRYRIGINVGEVIEDEGRIYGDGINIAARIEGLAAGGGICVSKSVYEQVKNKVDHQFYNLGKKKLKNISNTIEIYQIEIEKGLVTSEPTSVINKNAERAYSTLPERPSIAVLPFTNMSPQVEQEFLADGLADNIITSLSRTSEMTVIAQNSTFAYKGKSINIQQIGKELGVRYVLEGSIQRSGDRVRINAQLIDAKDGQHVWAERYDRETRDIFALQDEITLKVMTALQVKLTRGEQVRLWEGGTKNLSAFEAYYKAHDEYYSRGNRPRAVQLCQEAMSADKQYVEPIIFLGWLYMVDYWFGWSETPEKSREKAVELMQTALSLNDLIDPPHMLSAKIAYSYRSYEEALSEGERAVFLNPSGADACANFACVLTFSGMPEKGFYWLDKAFRLNPLPPTYYYAYAGMANNVMGRYEEAIEAYKKGLTINPDYLYIHVGLTESYSLLGRDEEALRSAAEVKRVHPGFSAKYHMKSLQYRNRDDEERFFGALSKAGL